ncbi:hypothetical protein I302_104870 [Kwoniella bestiolae CBS 10118]|uniref:Uncharacterized protein n=1 Tax=Kwoniella bestiolae CBS 10118 TaxID=1296100 RepID=A0A1B9FRK9_9TREE|nr:hypothetical protein I302_09059 [Kwoniella bestiolae CBS 10118]OCF21382.1 hypothetical protein I302_09059 [Kwoniella bestiolae CBS 10118]
MSGNKNITLDDPSPLLTYVGKWDGDDHEGDPFIDRYSNSTFHASSTLGDSMKFTFKGNGIWLFGAFRSNHEYYSTSIDGSPKIYNNGNRPVDVFTQVLYSNSTLGQGRHEVVLTNERGYNGTDPGEGYGWLDLDFVIYQTSSSPEGGQTKMGDMIFTTGTPRVQLHL